MAARRLGVLFFVLTLFAGLLLPVIGVSAQEQNTVIKTDAETAVELGLLIGDGSGVNTSYLAKRTTRLQAAIISLRLHGHLQDALSFTGTTNFSDAGNVSKANQAVLAYLKNHPEYGWSGKGTGKFEPSEIISSQQLYKVLLEIIGFQAGKEFTYAETESFAATKGLGQIAGASTLTNAYVATALVEALTVTTPHGHTLFAELQSNDVIATTASLPQGERIQLHSNAKLGTLFTDKNGRTLYFFTKDAEDPNACKGACLTNWPIYYSDELQIPAFLNEADFSVLLRSDGTKQLTYKGWPLYYFVKDAAAGDVKGEAVGGVWFVAKSDYKVMVGTSSTLSNYFTDDYGRTLYYFDKDIPQTSVCEGKCLTNWPAYTATGGSVPSTVTGSDFGTITRSDSSMQSAYKGYPLYYFIQDKEHGDIKGQNVNNIWFVIDPVKFNGTTAANVTTYHVDIKEFSFGTEPLTVKPGSRIVFTNYDDMKHNAVAVDGSFASPLLSKGETYTITLDKAGTYAYYCEPHKSFMTGQIIVK